VSADAAHLYGCFEQLQVFAENMISASPGESGFIPLNCATAPSLEILERLLVSNYVCKVQMNSAC
jgi:hypothetical protein